MRRLAKAALYGLIAALLSWGAAMFVMGHYQPIMDTGYTGAMVRYLMMGFFITVTLVNWIGDE